MLRTGYNKTAQKQQLRSLEIGDYAIDKQEELRQLDQYLEQLNYNEQDHALARARWSGGVGQKFGRANQRRPEATSAFWRGNPKKAQIAGTPESSRSKLILTAPNKSPRLSATLRNWL